MIKVDRNYASQGEMGMSDLAIKYFGVDDAPAIGKAPLSSVTWCSPIQATSSVTECDSGGVGCRHRQHMAF